MSEIADYYRKHDLDMEAKRHKFWTTKDGRKIPIIHLEDDHLRKIIKLFIRQGAYNKAVKSDTFIQGSETIADIASLTCDAEYDELYGMSTLDYVMDSSEIFRILWYEAIHIRNFSKKDFELYEASMDTKASHIILARINERFELNEDG